MHWIAYWYNQKLCRMATISISLPSGLTGDGTSLKDKVFLVVSQYGMYLNLKVHWPGILSNMGTIGNGWAGDRKFNPNTRRRMMTKSELCVKKLRKSVGISSTGNLYCTAKELGTPQGTTGYHWWYCFTGDCQGSKKRRR
jgi:hypothetical protein